MDVWETFLFKLLLEMVKFVLLYFKAAKHIKTANMTKERLQLKFSNCLVCSLMYIGNFEPVWLVQDDKVQYVRETRKLVNLVTKFNTTLSIPCKGRKI